MRRFHGVLALGASLALALSGCTAVVDGAGLSGVPPVAPDANVSVVGDSKGEFDRTVKNAIADLEAFWATNYPKVSGGDKFEKIKGKYWSVDGSNPSREATEEEACLARDETIAADNAFFCRLDDSIVWDRNPKHLIGVLGAKYGRFLIATVIAHEFGHAIQQRLKIFADRPPTLHTESQADCAAGAFIAEVLDFKTPHFRVSPEELDKALNGYFQVRDKTPETEADASHGNGFDRISAVADGIDRGIEYCFDDGYFSSRTFTERPFISEEDRRRGGNQCFDMVIDASKPLTREEKKKDCEGGGGLQPDLNEFWAETSKAQGKPWQNVKIAQAANPPCNTNTTSSEFDYCPETNTVYFRKEYAQRAYFSLSSLVADRNSRTIRVVENQAADFALGTLFALGWGMAVRHQWQKASMDDRAALLSAICYVGVYAKDINTAEEGFGLSPPDMDEATSALLNLITPESFGERDTTGVERIQAFTKGYGRGLSACVDG